MGLTSALNTAVFGISFNQRQIDVTASNIANADTAGYSKKTVSANAYFDGERQCRRDRYQRDQPYHQ
jgi:flagellar hook-associated protein 1 FlgK